MDEAAITEYITVTFDGIEVITALGNSFFMYDPGGKFPMATLVTHDDDYDQFSNLNRPSVFRLNIGVSKQTFQELFGTKPFSTDSNETESAYDFTALDKLMPHPVYGRMYWVSILNPSVTTFETQVRPLLDEAYAISVKKYPKKSEVS
ncbi:MAG TPA: DUF6194 family protein [Chloroflexia bacterium]|nr:DUF6194 family protein [Chloroflexia bacterium]